MLLIFLLQLLLFLGESGLLTITGLLTDFLLQFWVEFEAPGFWVTSGPDRCIHFDTVSADCVRYVACCLVPGLLRRALDLHKLNLLLSVFFGVALPLQPPVGLVQT